MAIDLNKIIIGVEKNIDSIKGNNGSTRIVQKSNERNSEAEEAAKNFEGMFMSHLMNEMMKTSGGGLMGKGLSGDIFQTLFVQQISEQLTQGRGLGLSDMIYKYFERTGIVEDSNETTEI